jgi:hypothetical protein
MVAEPRRVARMVTDGWSHSRPPVLANPSGVLAKEEQ